MKDSEEKMKKEERKKIKKNNLPLSDSVSSGPRLDLSSLRRSIFYMRKK